MSEATVAGFQLSPQQKHVWMSAGEQSPRVAIAVQLDGALNADGLKSALNAVVTRHEILRTSFERRPGMRVPVQVVQEQMIPSWENVDLRSIPAEQQSSKVDEQFAAACAAESKTAVHATLIVLSENKRVLILSLPALCADAASLQNMVREIADNYSAKSNDEEVFQYADFASWQNELLAQADDDAKAGQQYWNNLLADFVTNVKLPFEKKPAEIGLRPESIAIDVPKLPAQVSSDAASFFAACWHTLQWRLTGQTGIVVGNVCDGRNHEEVVGAIGLYTRSLPIPYEFTPTRSLLSVMQDLRNIKSAAYEQQDYLALDQSTQDLPIAYATESQPASMTANGVSFAVTNEAADTQRFRMQLRCITSGNSATLELRYDPAYFSRSAAERVATTLSALIRSAAKNPDAAIADLDILTDAERQQVVAEFNQTAAEFRREQCVHYLFEQQAQSAPNQPALRFGETSLTYAELNKRANQLAHALRSCGVKQDVAVGLCLDRSAEMIVALLGIIKAGGAYVPLVPDNPKARLAHQLTETKAPVVITESKHLANLPEFSGKTICLDSDSDMLSKQSPENPEHINAAENTVYVIYTSGSTGVPKGVAVSHANLVNYSTFILTKLSAKSVALNFATVSTLAADLGNTAIFPSLISGGCLHVIGYEMAMAGNLFGDYVKRHPIDVLKITPSHLNSLLASPEGENLLPRKYLVLGGEAATWDLVSRIKAAGKCAVINHYGPTEATVGCCTFSVADNDVTEWNPSTVPIGRPIANDRVYILDQQMRPVPVGVPGELCIGGAGIAKGYLNQPQQTAERFVKDPFSNDSNARLYRTGDLARFLPDGNVEFLGRIDQQVKIRGYRVEPAEIENLLKKHVAIQQVVVVPQEDKNGDKRLVAYAVSNRKPAPTSDELRFFLQERLPDYMVPAAIVLLETLPLTRNGKVDTSALPSPEEVVTQRIVIAPRNPVEQGLADIWRQVLKLEEIGVNDNFFDLGGHSLLATQVISRVRSTFHVQLPLRSLFDSPTVAGLADEIARMPQNSEDDEVAKLLAELEGISDEEAERLLANDLQDGDGSSSGNR